MASLDPPGIEQGFQTSDLGQHLVLHVQLGGRDVRQVGRKEQRRAYARRRPSHTSLFQRRGDLGGERAEWIVPKRCNNSGAASLLARPTAEA